MVTYFVGGAIGSASAAVVYGAMGWDGVCLVGATFAVLGLLLWVLTRRER
jgi:cyanate permease